MSCIKKSSDINKNISGFTIVELIVVIVIVGILAGISYISYAETQSRAITVSIQSDLSSASDILDIDQMHSSGNTFPATLAQANGGSGIPASENTAYSYTVDNTNNPRTFCLTATNGGQSYFTTQDGVSQPGACPSLYFDPGTATSYGGSGSTVTDLSGNGNSGTLYNSVGYSTSSGGSFMFNGTNNYIDAGSNLEWSGALTVESWHKRTTKDTVNADGIVGNWYWSSTLNNRRGWVQRYYINTDSLSFVVEVTDGVDVTELSTSYASTSVDNWYFTVGVFDPSTRTAKLYVNGVLRSSSTASVGRDQIAADSPNPMRIGYSPVNTGYFTGSIGDIRIHNRVLDDKEIQKNFDSLSGRYGL